MIVLFILLIIFFIILFMVLVETMTSTDKEQRYQEYKARRDKKEDLERELLEFAERYEKEKEDGD